MHCPITYLKSLNIWNFFNETIVMLLKKTYYQRIFQCHKWKWKHQMFWIFVKVLYWECREKVKKLWCWGKLSANCLKEISKQKYLMLRNHIQLGNSYAFPKAILHEYRRLCKFKYLSVVLLILYQMTQCIVLIVQYFYLWRNKGPSVLLLTKDKVLP